MAAMTTWVPFPRRNCPDVAAPARASIAACCDVWPVPPPANPAAPHAGAPPDTTSACPLDPMPIRCGAPAVPPSIRSPAVVIGLVIAPPPPAPTCAHVPGDPAAVQIQIFPPWSITKSPVANVPDPGAPDAVAP